MTETGGWKKVFNWCPEVARHPWRLEIIFSSGDVVETKLYNKSDLRI